VSDTAGSSLGACLARLRAERGLTRVVLAGRSGVSPDLIKKLESGARHSARLSTVRALAGGLGVSVSDLLEGVEVHPLRRIRRQRGLTLAVLAGQVGVSAAFLSLVETGARQLRNPAHIVALASVLRVRPVELVPWLDVAPGAAGGSSRASGGFPVVADAAAVARHGRLAGEFVGLLAAGQRQEAGALLHRAAGQRAVDPWLLLDQFTRQAVTELVGS
jgi:transcriptional regulator with XRE-family HTH domain